ncbi:transposase [Tautonia rosea]|uniref:transposase n=1 Tax=Tautonia rosea TaxID=2728037 RepID=UPI0014743777|nr:transposase [Tautonia rosea]
MGAPKRVKHGHEPGDLHELTFSCYRRLPLLTNDRWRTLLARAIDSAVERHEFHLIAFVFMPGHVHLLVLPLSQEPRIDRLLKAIKRPFSGQIKRDLITSGSRLLDRLIVRERPGRSCFRFWQEGPGFDRNLNSEAAVMAAIEHIHLNPVRRRLCSRADAYRWSSAWRFDRPELPPDPDLPTLHNLSYEVFTGPETRGQ